MQALFAILWAEEIPVGGICIKESDDMSLEHSSDVTRRLARIAGQINGIRDMVEDGRECEDILVQLSSASSALTQVARIIVTEHLEYHVLDGFRSGDEEGTIKSLKTVVDAFAKMK